jgi:ribosomal protein L11 methyltransferase
MSSTPSVPDGASTPYVETRIYADPLLTDALIGILGQIGFEGFWEDEDCLKAYIRLDRWSPALAEEVEATLTLVARSSRNPVPRMAVEMVAHRNWNEEWEKTIQPIAVTDKIVITPSWHSYSALPGNIVLTIDPKMSFGTGYHESTRLVLHLMESRITPGMNVLDIGTGTGILAIAAVRLGAATAFALDTDDWAYRNACENVLTNGVADRVTVLHGDLSTAPRTEFDLILANIQRTIIVEILADTKRLLHSEGSTILSGLLLDEEDLIKTSLSQLSLQIVDRKSENEWLALVVRKLA